MKFIRCQLALAVILSIFGINQASGALRVDTSMIDGIKVHSPTRVVAGKYFNVKLTSNKVKAEGVCWLDWEFSKGFTFPKEFRMKNGVATVKLLPVAPGPGEMSFYCGSSRSNIHIGGSKTIYIAP
jgi:hypothetical protein